jgi:ribosome-associated toxin RatA of RatAB toxin-antitoxin module
MRILDPAVVVHGPIPDNFAMRQVRRSALIAQPPARIYALIADIESYPRFLPWCTAARIDSAAPTEVIATLAIQRGPLRTEFTTRNTLDPGRSIAMALERGPFRVLEGLWSLLPIGADGCKVELTLGFEFSNRLSAALLEPVFEETAGSLVDAFVARAREVYRA